MELLEKFRQYLYQHKLKKRISDDHQAVSITTAKKIGILFDATDEKDVMIIRAYKKELINRKKIVRLMAYKDTKIVEQDLGFECFCNKDLAFDRTPLSNRNVTDFIQTPFELLISLHMSPNPSLEFISAASKAKFRIGPYQASSEDAYDLMLYGKHKSLRVFIKTMEEYLEKIS